MVDRPLNIGCISGYPGQTFGMWLAKVEENGSAGSA